MMDGGWVFLDIDTQVDFMLPHGALYVPGAEQIIPNLRALMVYAQEHQIPVLSSADAHAPDDPSFAQWPPHCVVGTEGQRRIPETQLSPSLVIPNRVGAFTPPLQPVAQVIVEKVDYDISSNPNFDAVLSALAPRRFVAFGVATEYCVQASVLALLRRGFEVALVTDAVRAITEEGSRKALDLLYASGVRSIQTSDIVAGSAMIRGI